MTATTRGPIADAIVKAIAAGGGTMTAADLAEFQPEWVEPIRTTYRGWTVSEIPPQGQGIAVLMMLNLMERFPIGEYGFHSPRALHVLIEAKKLAYADLLRYVGDPRMARCRSREMLRRICAAERARLIDPARPIAPSSRPCSPAITDSRGNDTIYLTTTDRDGNMVSLIQSNYSGFGSGVVPEGVGFMLHNRGALFTLEAGQPNTLAPRKRPLHTIIPGFMEKDGTRIGFGIMGGWNQAQAHAQFVAEHRGLRVHAAGGARGGALHQEDLRRLRRADRGFVPESTRAALAALGHVLKVEPRRSSVFGYGQAILARPDGVHLGASEPRHDGEAIPEAPDDSAA